MAETAKTTKTAAKKTATAAKKTTATAKKAATPKSAAAKRGSAGATARKTAATKRSTAAQKAARTRAAHETADAINKTDAAKSARKAEKAAEQNVVRVQKVAERVMLTQLGAGVVARDAALGAVSNVRSTFANPGKELKAQRKRLENEMQRFEKRGATARDQINKDLTARRKRIEKEYSQLEKDLAARRSRLEKELKDRTAAVTRQVKGVRTEATADAEYGVAKAENIVQTGLTRGQQIVTKVTEKVTASI